MHDSPPQEMERHTEASACVTVRVRADGELVAVDSRAGVLLVRRLDPLARFAVAFLRTHVRDTRFLWIADAGSWYAAGLRRERPTAGANRAASAIIELEPTAPPYGLTVRELDVLTLICGGLSNPEIAVHLTMSTRTASTHVAHLIAKLGQSSRAGVAALAIDQGLLRLPVPGSGRALGALSLGLIDQIASGLAPTPVPAPDPGWLQVLRPRLQPLRLGTLIDAHGNGDDDGEQVRNGSALAVAAINARGGVGGRIIEQVLARVDGDCPGSFGGALAYLADADVHAIVGGYTNFLAPDAYASTRDHGCPILTAMTSEEQASWVRSDPVQFGRVFQVGPTEVNYGTGVVAFLERLRAASVWAPRRPIILPVETPVDAGRPFGPLALERAAAAGWEVQRPLLVPLHDVDWTAVMERVHEREPGAIVLAHFNPHEAAGFQHAFATAGLAALVYMIYAPSLPAFLREAGADAEGVVWSTVTGTYSDALGDGFRRQYLASFGVVPGRSLAGSAFDQVHILALAWSRVGDARRFGAVAEELRRITYRGVNGSYVLGSPGQSGRSYPLETSDPSLGQAHLVFQVQEGAHRVLYPPPYSEAHFRAPPWTRPSLAHDRLGGRRR